MTIDISGLTKLLLTDDGACKVLACIPPSHGEGVTLWDIADELLYSESWVNKHMRDLRKLIEFRVSHKYRTNYPATAWSVELPESIRELLDGRLSEIERTEDAARQLKRGKA